MTKICISDTIPDEVIDTKLTELEAMRQTCETNGGSLETRVLYGCNDKSLDDYKGSSPRIPYEDPDGTRLDYLPGPDGIVPSIETVRERVKQRQAAALRDAINQAEEAAKNKTDCSENADPAFVVQVFCKGKGGSTLPGGTGYTPPFMTQK